MVMTHVSEVPYELTAVLSKGENLKHKAWSSSPEEEHTGEGRSPPSTNRQLRGGVEWIYVLLISPLSAELEAVKLTLAFSHSLFKVHPENRMSAKGRSTFLLLESSPQYSFTCTAFCWTRHVRWLLHSQKVDFVLDIIVWLCFWHCIWTLFLTFRFHSRIAWQQRNVPAVLFLFSGVVGLEQNKPETAKSI